VKRIDLFPDEYRELDADCGGVCTACGELVYGVDPDACDYTCDSCGARKVYGVETALLVGAVNILDAETEHEAEMYAARYGSDSDW